MKVAWLCDGLYLFSGVAKQVKLAIREWSKERADQHIAIGDQPYGIKMARHGTVWIGGFDIEQFLVDDRNDAKEVGEVLAMFQPDVVIVVGDLYYMKNVVFSDLTTKYRFVWWHLHDSKVLVEGASYQAAYERMAGIACINRLAYDHLKGRMVMVESVPHAVDTAIYMPANNCDRATMRERYGIHEERFVAIWNNRMIVRKRPLAALGAWALFEKNVGKDNVAIVWHTNPDDPEGINAEHAWKMVEAESIVTSFERKSESELASMYGMCDACFTVSSREGFGLGTMEAAACGLPIVVPDVGGLKDQVVTPEGKNVGVLKRPTLTNVVLDIEGNLVEECYVREKEISDSLRWLYRMRRSKRRAIGEACREHVTKEFSIKRMLDGFFSLMERVTK